MKEILSSLEYMCLESQKKKEKKKKEQEHGVGKITKQILSQFDQNQQFIEKKSAKPKEDKYKENHTWSKWWKQWIRNKS